MERRRRAFRVVLMVRVLGVSRSGYYAWRNRVDVSERQHAREKRDALVAHPISVEHLVRHPIFEIGLGNRIPLFRNRCPFTQSSCEITTLGGS